MKLDTMDLKSNHAAPVRPDTPPMNKSRLGGLHPSLPFSHSGPALSPPKLLTIPRKKTGVLDDVRSSSWLDSMRASSPPHKKLQWDIGSEAFGDSDIAYLGWQLKYPSALTSFDSFTNIAKAKRIALFLDYDGTLSPIVDNPDQAVMSDDMRSAVKNVAQRFPTAIISGRSRDKVFEFVGLSELYYAGSHGMDIMVPASTCQSSDKHGTLFQPASEFVPMIDEVFHSLVEATRNISGANVENNKFCVSVHYRNVKETDWEAVIDCVFNIIKDYPRLRLTHGRKVLEIRPVINWDKGKAVTFLLDTLGLTNCDDLLSVYVGDDRTDEDAFKVLRERSCGYGIIVSATPKESYANFSLRDPSEVLEFLKSLVSWKQSSSL